MTNRGRAEISIADIVLIKNFTYNHVVTFQVYLFLKIIVKTSPINLTFSS